jgi:hypothetical protein
MRATKESNDFTSGEIIGRLLYMRAVRDNIALGIVLYDGKVNIYYYNLPN